MDGVQNVNPGFGSTSSKAANFQQKILGKEDFLRLLITQLNYQDPLNPMQNEEFVAQLAQFSSLEQMQNLNEKLEASLRSDMLLAQAITNSLVTTLIGKEVKIQTPQMVLSEEGTAALSYTLDSSAKNVVAEVYDSNDTLVYTENLGTQGSGEHTFTWNGCNTDGQQQQPGSYHLKIKVIHPDDSTSEAVTHARGRVDSIRYQDGKSYLVVNGITFNLADVVEVLEP